MLQLREKMVRVQGSLRTELSNRQSTSSELSRLRAMLDEQLRSSSTLAAEKERYAKQAQAATQRAKLERDARAREHEANAQRIFALLTQVHVRVVLSLLTCGCSVAASRASLMCFVVDVIVLFSRACVVCILGGLVRGTSEYGLAATGGHLGTAPNDRGHGVPLLVAGRRWGG